MVDGKQQGTRACDVIKFWHISHRQYSLYKRWRVGDAILDASLRSHYRDQVQRVFLTHIVQLDAGPRANV